MALTASRMMPLGTRAPGFQLLDTVAGRMVDLERARGERGTVVMFICNHCPYVKHVQGELVRVAAEYAPRGIAFIAISSNDAQNYPEDGPDRMRDVAREQGYPFPYLYDETQQVARDYGAACTPDFFVFDAELKCVYRGRLDGSSPGNGIPVTGAELRGALEALVSGQRVAPAQHPSMGCNIKWRRAA